MLKRFIELLEEHLAEVGIVGLIEAILGILAAGGILSAVFGDTTIKVAAVVAVMLSILGMFIILFMSHAVLRKRNDLDRKLLARYCDVLFEEMQCAWKLLLWDQKLLISLNGDSKQTMTIHGVVESRKLSYYRLRIGPGWNQPPKFQRKVRVQVRSLEIEGLGGTRSDVTTFWLRDGRLEILVHFPEPIDEGIEFRVVVQVEWPGKCRPLMVDRVPDEFCHKLFASMARLNYKIVLPAGVDAYCDPIGFRHGQENISLTSKRNSSEQLEITLRAKAPRAPGRVGVRIDLK